MSATARVLKGTTWEVKEPPAVVVGQVALPNIPQDVWDARSELAVIRANAHRRGSSADVALYTVLLNLIAVMPSRLAYDTGMLSPVSPNLFAAIVAQSGLGKTSGVRVGRDMLPPGMCQPLPVGSGEGFVESFYGTETIPPPAGSPPGTKPTKVRKRVRGNNLFSQDEGEGFGQLRSRANSTLSSVLRSAWSGDDIGQTNADGERSRVLAAGTYVAALMVNLQPAICADLLGDTGTGMAQRFVWVAALDRGIPADLPRDGLPPTVLQWTPPDLPANVARSPMDQFLRRYDPDEPRVLVPVAQEITDELWRHHVAVRRGDVTVAEHDSQRPAQRVKMAGALAWLDRRLSITPEDWQLAGALLDTSDAVRERLIEHSAEVKRDELTVKGFDRARVAQAEDQADKTRDRCREKVLAIVSTNEEVPARDVMSRVSRYQREFLPEVLAELIELGRIAEVTTSNGSKRYRRAFPQVKAV